MITKLKNLFTNAAENTGSFVNGEKNYLKEMMVDMVMQDLHTKII